MRICLPVQGTWVRALVGEDPACWGATTALELLKAVLLEPVLCNKKSHCSEKPVCCREE